MSLIFANNTEEDVFLKEELESFAEKHSNFKLHYVLVQPPEGWRYSKGFVSQEIIEKYLPVGKGEDSLVCICGPPPMIKFACTPALEKIGYPTEDVLIW